MLTSLGFLRMPRAFWAHHTSPEVLITCPLSTEEVYARRSPWPRNIAHRVTQRWRRCSVALIRRNIRLGSRFRHGFINHLIVGSPSPRRPSFAHFTSRILCAITMAEAICTVINNIHVLTTFSFCTLFVGFGHFVSCDCRRFHRPLKSLIHNGRSKQ